MIGRARGAARRLADTLYRVGRPSREGTEPPHLPPDVMDEVALRVWLEDVDLFDSDQELHEYLNDSLTRFRYTAAILPRMPRAARVLELGSNPYFLTRILQRRGLELTSANWFGPSFGATGEQTLSSRRRSERMTIRFDHFNAETERFPYADDQFQAVLCCGILELLPADPTHLLAEIHRVLAPDGHLVLTTPNAARAETLLRVSNGSGFHEKLSGHGVYGHANREYTIDEVTDLLSELGYEIELAKTLRTSPADPPLVPPLARPTNRGDTTFLRARAVGRPRWRYPTWLYSSTGKRWQVVQPDVAMGYNDELQTRGFEPRDEILGRWGRWLSGSTPGQVLLWSPGAGSELVVEGVSPPPQACRGLELVARAGDVEVSWRIEPDGKPFRVAAPFPCEAGAVELELTTNHAWRPIDVGLGADDRAISLIVVRVALERTADGTEGPH